MNREPVRQRVLFVVPYPTEGPSNRVRIEQHLPSLIAGGFSVTVRPFLSSRGYRILYERGHTVQKIGYFVWGTLKRLADLVRGLRYDVIVVHRETLPIGPPLLEWCWAALGKPLVFDFDDAIFLPYTSHVHPWLGKLKSPTRVARTIRLARWVIAGNDYLANFARHYNSNVSVIPSVVDTERYRPVARRPQQDRVVIGWIGSRSTVGYLEMLRNVFHRVGREHPDVEFHIIGGQFEADGLPNVVHRDWHLATELSELQQFDIGIMPMPDDPWTQGKCGYKALLCMSMGIPVVCSPVGVNTQIVEDGRTGILARSEEEWVTRLSELVRDPELRRRLGRAGRRAVEERYALPQAAEALIETLERAAA